MHLVAHRYCDVPNFRLKAIECDRVVQHEFDVCFESLDSIILVSVEFLPDGSKVASIFARYDFEICRNA